MKNKKMLATFIASMMLFSGNVFAQDSQMTVSDNLISMVETEVIEINTTFDGKIEPEDVEFNFGGKSIDKWKTWNKEMNAYTGPNYIDVISIVTRPNKEGTQTEVNAELRFNLLYGVEDLSPRSVRVLYPEKVGNYDLEISADNQTFSEEIKLNAYDSLRTFDEIKPELDSIIANTKNMYISYESMGKSVEGRDQHMIIIGKDKAAVNTYLNKTSPTLLENPEKIQDEIEDHKAVVFMNNIHPDENPGVTAQLDFLQNFTTQPTIEFKSLDEDNNEITKTLDPAKVLDEVILVLSITENPDGSYHNTRQNINGFDLNRDNSYQTQPETVGIVEQIVKWTPVSFLDLHGYVNSFLIEPCTPPHEQNYEYDLIEDYAIEQAHALGKAGISNTKYESYQIPLIDDVYRGEDGSWTDVWDDGSLAYTATFAQAHGALGHTVEIPDLHQASNDAMLYALYGAVDYVTENKDALLANLAEIYKRGINNEDSPSVDSHLINAKNEAIGRDRGENENFFPEYYVLPIDDELQKNPVEVYAMVEYLLRNGIKVDKLTEDTTICEDTYKEGSFVVDMHQAKRGYANAMLYAGDDVSDFPSIYAEVVNNFPASRGFNCYEIRTENAFGNNLCEIDEVDKPATTIEDKKGYYVVKNNSNDVIKAVNELLALNKEVYLLNKDSEINEAGDFLISKYNLSLVSDDYLLKVVEYTQPVEAKQIYEPVVLSEGIYSDFALNELGFNVVDEINDDVTVIVDENGTVPTLENGVDYVGVGDGVTKVAGALIPELKLFATEGLKNWEGLLKADYNPDSVLTSGYDDEEFVYSISGNWIEEVPEGVETLITVQDADDFYVAGWWPEHEKVKGKALAVSTDIEDSKVTLYTNSATNRAHQQNAYRLLANAIYQSSLSDNIETIEEN
ncbi:hypothetical protein AN644_04230 [Candidatus Epulonipiscium fishelsonii]|nr:hypothetical protein AN644_04230 [Epulopiscium sp. SCG-C06WGA-EpuloA1]